MKKRFLSLFLALAMLLSMSVAVNAQGTIKDVSSYVVRAFDFDADTPAIETEVWQSGENSQSIEGNVWTLSGKGNTNNSKAVFYGLKTDGAYKAVPILATSGDDKIFRISFEYTNKKTADASMQLGFQPLQADAKTSNGRNFIYKFNLNNGEITSNGGEKATIAATVDTPVKVNMIMNLKTGASRLYVDKDTYISNTNVFSNSGAYLKAALFWVDQAVEYNYQLKNLEYTVYSAETTMDEVAAYAYASADELYDPTQQPVEPEEPEIVYEEGIKDLSDYTLNGYNNKQLNNNWANVTLSDVTDENGVITTTASHTGDLASGKRIASFQPWAEYQGIGSNASGHNIFQFGFTVNEITSPVYLEYNYSRDGGAKKSLISFSDSKVVAGGSMNGDTFIEVKAPYTINIFMNIKTYKGMIYVNDQLLYQGNLNNSSADKKWREVRVISLENSKDIKLVTTKANSSIFNSDVAFTNVVDYVLNREDAVNTNWIWKIDGFNLNMGNMQGAVDGVTNVTGNNEDGYVLQPNSINASHYGFARYFLAQESGTALAKSDNDKVLWQSFEYNPTVLTSGQIFEIRGNNAYQTLMRAVPATETEPAYLETTSGGKVCNLDESKFYKIDLIVNNKDYEYYIVVDGKVAAHDIIWDSRQPLWNTVFSSYTTDEKMTIKNLETTVYDDTVTMADVLKKVSTSVYTDISDVVYDDSAKELTVTATFTGDETLFETAELVYAAFDADGTLVAVDVVTAYSEDVNATEFGRAYPYGFLDISNVAEGEKLNIKALLWENLAGVTPISNVGTCSYTVPTTAVVE